MLQSLFVAQRIKDAKKGVMVKISPSNSKKIVRITEKSRRTFSTEVNFVIEEYLRITENDK